MIPQRIKEAALRLGADIVGIGSSRRWEGTPAQMDSKQIVPWTKSIFAMGCPYAYMIRLESRGVLKK